MIKNSSKQTGSAHVVISIILVTVILGILGFLFWKNFVNDDSSKKQESAEQVQTQPAVEDDSVKPEKLTESYTMPKEGLSFSYPKTWELNTIYTNKDSDIGENRVLLVSPNNFAIQIDIPSYGPPWQFGERPMRCPFDEGYSHVIGEDDNHDGHADICPFYTELMSEKAPNINGLSIMVFGVSYEKVAGITPRFDLTLVKTGCKMPENNLCERPPAKAGYYLGIHGGYYDKVTDEDKKIALLNTSYSNNKQIKAGDFLKSQDVVTAIAILKSMEY